MAKQFNQGLTLIEVLLTAALIGILGLGVVGLQFIITQNQLTVLRNYVSVDEANANIAVMVREIRNARPSESGAYTLERALDQEFVFYSDVDFDGEAEKVRYTLAGTQFVRGVIEPQGFPASYPAGSETTKVLTENVRNGAEPIFTYYNGDWPVDTVNNPLAQPVRLSETKMMKVNLVINPDADSPERNFLLESYVQIRMLKDNL